MLVELINMLRFQGQLPKIVYVLFFIKRIANPEHQNPLLPQVQFMAIHNKVYLHIYSRIDSLKRVMSSLKEHPERPHICSGEIAIITPSIFGTLLCQRRALVFMSPRESQRPYVTFILCFNHKCDYLA